MLRRLVTVAIGTFCALIVGLPSVDIAVAGAQAVMQGPQGPQGRGMPRDQPPGERKGMGAIRGRVTALDTGRPLRRARINVNAPELQETRNVSTGSDGRFEISNLPAGDDSASVVRGGYLRLGYGQKRPGDPPGRVEVADGQVVSDVNFVLPRMSVISGRVFDEVGEPIAGVTITAQQMRFYEGRRKLVPLGGIATTDDTGQYRLLNLEPGEYYVVRTVRSDKAGTFRLTAMPPGEYLAVALEYVLDGDWNDPQFLESLREAASRVTLREGEAGTAALQVKAGS
jgi:hypothetical protein